MAQILYWCNSNNIKRLGLPYLIGCGLAGGDKQKVLDILNKVQEEIPQVEIQIYKKED